VKLSDRQRDALLMADSEKEREYIKKMIREHGEFYQPATPNSEEWWPNRYPDM
jgi:hypothetical protein